jgi:hypothetical protein
LLPSLQSFGQPNFLDQPNFSAHNFNFVAGDATSSQMQPLTRTTPAALANRAQKNARERTPLLKGSLRIRIKQELRAPAKRQKKT